MTRARNTIPIQHDKNQRASRTDTPRDDIFCRVCTMHACSGPPSLGETNPRQRTPPARLRCAAHRGSYLDSRCDMMMLSAIRSWIYPARIFSRDMLRYRNHNTSAALKRSHQPRTGPQVRWSVASACRRRRGSARGACPTTILHLLRAHLRT